MFESQSDSDDDCKGYFLRPANEYNIIDKINEANQKLFSSPKVLSPSLHCQQRRVLFRTNLEDYEPTTDNDIKSETEKDDNDSNSNYLNSTSLDEDHRIHSNGSPIRFRKGILNDVETLQIIKIDSPIHFTTTFGDVTVNQKFKKDNLFDKTNYNNVKMQKCESESDSEIEDVCEKIITLEMNDNDGHNNQKSDDHDDDGEEEFIPIRNSPPPESCTTALHQSQMKCSHTESLDYDEIEVDDDNNLSVIVAHYIVKDSKEKSFENGNDVNDKKLNGNTDKELKKQKKYKKINPFKISSRKYTSSKINEEQQTKNNNKTKNNDHNDIMKLKLNKICCEYKVCENIKKLPKYTGYLSEYGLSKKQSDRREKLLNKQNRKLFEKRLKENENKRNDDNERAFTNWLKNKMRCPKNITKNMYDCNSSRISGNKIKTEVKHETRK